MQVIIAGKVLEIVQGDITAQNVDAIVNAANSGLLGGGGVDGAIHRSGGATIMAQTTMLYPQGCATGSAVITRGGHLPAKYVIHAVGPVWNGGCQAEAMMLSAAYESALSLALEHECQSIAFPALSTGAYGYPVAEAAEVALGSVREFLLSNSGPELVRFVLFSEETLETFRAQLERLQPV